MSQRELKITVSANGASTAAKELGQVDSKIKSIRDLGGAISAKGKDLQRWGASMTLATVPIAGVLGYGTKVATEVDTVVRKVSTLADAEIMPIDKIKDEIRDISDYAGREQSEVGEAMYTALSSGVDTDIVSEFTSSAIDLTKAGFTDMQTAIDATTTVMNAYGEQSEEVSKIHDIFVKTQDLGKISVDELGSSIGRVIPTASSAGVGLDQLGTAYAILTAKGQAPTIATTNLNRMLVELSSTGTNADKVLRRKTGKSFRDLSKEGKNLGEVLSVLEEEAEETGLSMQDMFGSVNAAQAAQSLLSEGAEGYADTLKEIQDSDGITAINAEAMEGPAEALRRMKVNVQNIAGDLGEAFLPILADTAESISGLTEHLKNMDKETLESLAQWGGLLVALGPVVSILGTVGVVGGKAVSAISFVGGKAITLIKALAPIGGVVKGVAGAVTGAFGAIATATGLPVAAVGAIAVAIGAVVGAGVTLVRNWDEVKAKADELGGGLKGYLLAALDVLGDKFSSVGDVARGALDGIKNAWESLKNAVKKPISAVVNVGRKVFGGTDGSHDTGLGYVPYDGYVGELHKGEMVLPEKTAEAYRQVGGDINNLPIIKESETTVNNLPIVREVETTVNNLPVIQGGEDDPKEELPVIRDYRTENINQPITYTVGDINITVEGNADEDTAINIGQQVRDEVEGIFMRLNLQRG